MWFLIIIGIVAFINWYDYCAKKHEKAYLKHMTQFMTLPEAYEFGINYYYGRRR